MHAPVDATSVATVQARVRRRVLAAYRRRRLIAFIVESAVIVRGLDHLGEPTRAPRRAPIRGPPWADERWDAMDVSHGATTYPNPAADVMPEDESQRHDLSW